MLSIEKSAKKHIDYIKAINELNKKLSQISIVIAKTDEFDLGGQWDMYYQNNHICVFIWNIPYYLEFSSFDSSLSESFVVDNVKNIEDWRLFLEDIYNEVVILSNIT